MLSVSFFAIRMKAKYKRLNLQYENLLLEYQQKDEALLMQFVDELKVYSVSDANGEIKLIRHGKNNDGGYVVAEKAFLKADALMGYGIFDDISFEDTFSLKYDKPSYGYDCGVRDIARQSKQCHFIDECIATGNFLYENMKSSNKMATFTQQVTKAGLQNKKVFIKMDIEGAEYDAFEDILKHTQNVTGMVVEFHFETTDSVNKAIKLLKNLKEHFYLIHLHANNCVPRKVQFSTKNLKGKLVRVLELSFIHKSLVTKAELLKDQTFPKMIDQPNCPNVIDHTFKLLSVAASGNK